MLKFFDYRGRIGRWDYFKATMLRSVIASVILISIVIPQTGGINNVGTESLQVQRIFGGLFRLIMFLPLILRRANDANISYKWIAPTFLFFLIPVEFTQAKPGSGLWMLLSIYDWMLSIVILFKPGQAHQDFLKSKENDAEMF